MIFSQMAHTVTANAANASDAAKQTLALVKSGSETGQATILGNMWGRMQRYISRVKQDINQSVELADLRELESKAKAEVDAVARSVQQAGSDIDYEARQLENELVRSAQRLGDAAQPSSPPLPPSQI